MNKGKFSSIFIANLSEISLNLVAFMKPDEVEAEISEDHELSDRFIFSQSRNSVIVTPYLLNTNFLEDSLRILGINNVKNLAPKNVGQSICQSILGDGELLDQLCLIIENNRGIKIYSYAGTPDFYQLIDYFYSRHLKFITPEVPEKNNRWTNVFFGSKAGFRQTVGAIDVLTANLPTGAICSNQAEVVGWAKYFIDNFDGCVLKTNRGLAGAGLRIIHKAEVKIDTEKYLDDIIASEDYWHNFPIVVEKYIQTDLTICGGAPNIELQIADGKIRPLYVCGMRVTPEGVFLGVEMGKDAVPETVTKYITSAGKSLGEKLLNFGYNGFFEIDFVQGLDGKSHPIESNLRRTGGTHAFELAQKLFGESPLINKYFVTNNRVVTTKFQNKTYADLKNNFQKLLYPINGKGRGLIFTVVSSLHRGRVGYVIVGNDQSDAYSVEKQFLRGLTE